VHRERVRRRGRAGDVVGAAITAVLSFTIVPAVLVFVVGNPLAGGLGHDWRPLSRDTMCVLVLAAWVAWAACCVQLLRAVANQVRRGSVAPLASRSFLDRVAARIALGVLAISSFSTPLVLASGAGAAAPVGGHVGVPAVHVRAGAGSESSVTERVSSAVHVVRPGETLWAIAERRMDDGADWTSIAALNLGRPMAGGTHFVDPDQVRAGWRLRLPDSAHGTHERSRPAAPTPGPGGAEDPVGSHLPELLALGLGSMTCAAVARRTRRHRECDRYTGDLNLGPSMSEEAVDTETLVNRFAGVPALASFEAANVLLKCRIDDRATSPRVRAISVCPEGVTFWLSEPDGDPPEGFIARQDGVAWHVEHAQLTSVEPLDPLVPIALPIGDDDEGTWFVALYAGSALPVFGESAVDLCRAARAAQQAWSWADSVQVTEDPAVAAVAAGPERITDTGAGAPRVLYFGDPGALQPGLAHRVAVVTTGVATASDVTVLVDRHGATIHPIGRVLRPHLLSAEQSGLVDEITTGPRTEPQPAETERPNNPAGAGAHLIAASTLASTPGHPLRREPLAPGPVDVRLLTATPRLDGLEEELPPNRARRAVELVAYLALHQPDVITSDRLRTRVLGSSDADAASKTLFNVAHAARRAMGTDQEGRPLFPAGSRNGLYQVSPDVTVDVQRAMAFVAEGKECAQSELAMAHFRAALELVEGEPLANALSGYTWWESEGHGARVSSVLVDAACSLAELATEARLFGLAWLGLERAQLLAPYSEALSRAAMAVAAAEGDADRLRHEWRECQRRVDALDPGSSPSTRTESLYGELARRILAHPAGDPVSSFR
jgi:DNA-binding SARP family transcriptional activator